MRWPWQRRRTTASVARHALPRQASWAQAAYPQVLAGQPNARPGDAQPPAAEPAQVAVPAQMPGVLLGFADGSQVALDDGDPHAVALRAVASILSEQRRMR